MSLKGDGMQGAIIAALPDPKIKGYTKKAALDAAGGTASMLAIGQAVVSELTTNGLADVDLDVDGTCQNFTAPGSPPVPTMGNYSARLSVSSAGKFKNLDATRIANDIRTRIGNTLTGTQFTDGEGNDNNASLTIDAIAEAVVNEIHSRAKMSLVRAGSSVVQGIAPAVVSPATEEAITEKPGLDFIQGRVECTIDSMNVGMLKEDIKNRIKKKIDPDDEGIVNFAEASAEATVNAVATGIIGHIEKEGRVPVTNDNTDLSGVTCPANPAPSGSPGVKSSGSVLVRDARIV